MGSPGSRAWKFAARRKCDMTFLRRTVDPRPGRATSCERVHVSRRRASYLPARRVIVGFRAFWPRSIVFHCLRELGRLPGCGPCRPCGTPRRPTLGRARNEFNSTALRNWLRSHSSGKFLIVCPAAVGGVRAFPPRGWSSRSSGGLTTSIYAWDTAGVSRVFRAVSRTRVPLAC